MRAARKQIVMQRGRIKPYLPRLFGYAVSLSRDQHQAEDLVQECAVRALGATNIPRDERAYRAWLFRILRNLFLDQARRKASTVPLTEATDVPPETEYWQGEERLINVLTVRLEMAKLAPAQREIIALIDLVGLTYAETAEFLEVPIGTVMSRISRARRALLDAIGSSNVHEFSVKARKSGR